ncbi:hypothetical protein J2S00_002938 [Caldalkalibacillus uzonensis]|uniref:Uncharacterized protein n=1 Tax=Caldalkalibacillus uzonensis TaxID=353224 RepID=A0ABU0CVL7_9BACI|nr:hypothetical protein [Caldalkalibacillus uzonensis]MDQ0340143.1 hypothetical protein [Caldalkalibacillus uzonensis]
MKKLVGLLLLLFLLFGGTMDSAHANPGMAPDPTSVPSNPAYME